MDFGQDSGAALPSGSAGAGWAMRVGQDTRLIANSDNSVLYLAPEGREGLFQPATATTYTPPAGFKVAMVKTSRPRSSTSNAPNDTAPNPADGPQTYYTLNAQELVTKVVDPLNRVRSKTCTPFNDTATSTNGVGGVPTFGHNPAVNGGESLTDVTSAMGAKSTAAYANTGASKYLPSGGKDSQGNNRLFTYDGAGNQLTSANSSATSTSTSLGLGGSECRVWRCSRYSF
ncbi:hypothetical protein HPO96_09715 [Kribbella sandramycini]|uniref:YD repeat-containing protein n=1 Tax=Kribbella sandramycini TaxID=60450 RepID=A0A7Y4NYH1_9ACTN|nr:hypothetical protein [Kribbella sandramycini]MBB6569647.1 hypothetical protein [Kribbella sandramycini]NOL40521.1 hypothetical protein [Kribbella sandramycini]